MKLLIVSWYFPPGNTIGAVRLGKLGKFLHERGVDFRVLTGSRWGLPETLPLEVPPERVVGTDWFDVSEPPAPLRAIRGLLRRGQANGAAAPSGLGAVASGASGSDLAYRLGNLYRLITHFPDRHVGWLPYALRAGGRLCREWRPDLIYASAPPYTTLLVGASLGRRYGVPWVAEFRDRWVDDPYYGKNPLRLALETRLERWAIDSAAGIVTVSEPWAEAFRRKFGKPVATVLNGFDPADYPLAPPEPEPEPGPEVDPGRLRILYTGAIYAGRRDPTPLFKALAGFGPDADKVRVVFYGTRPEDVLPLARAAGVEHLVEMHPSVPYRRSIALQRTADVLLLMQWDDPREQGNVPAKLFEYLGAMRPILGIGYEGGVPARIIGERGAGLFSNDPDRIARQLREWLDRKRTDGAIARLGTSVRDGFSRDEQFEGLVAFLDGLASRAGSARHLKEIERTGVGTGN